MKKKEREELEARTRYTVCKAAASMGHGYEVRRLVDGKQKALYYVTLVLHPGGIPTIWCDCPGFRMQKYAHIEHKHVKLVMEYQDCGEPLLSTFIMKGTGQNVTIIHEFSSCSIPIGDDT